MNAEFDWRSLEDPLPEATKSVTPAPTFPCGQCAGTGRWISPLGRKSGPCHACKGKGHFLQSYADRMKARRQREERKAAKVDRIRSELNTANAGLVEWMAENAHWCSFAADLLGRLNQGHELSERQIEALNRTRAKVEASRAAKAAERAAERESAQVKVDLAPVRAMFEAAAANGLKKPQFRAEGLTLSLAPMTGRNPGAIYVKRGGEYLGKVEGIVFKPVGDGAAAAETLLGIAVDPMEAAVRYGRETGVCACCGRQLTDPESVAAGIGPICATKWGF